MKTKRGRGVYSTIVYLFFAALGWSLHTFVCVLNGEAIPSTISLPSFHSINNEYTNSNLDTSINGTCDKLMESILRRQACFHRQQLLEKQNSQFSFLSYHQHNDDDCFSRKPFYNYAYFEGQGMGRIMEHTVAGCMFSHVVLKRPCILDFNTRDPFHTWRNFLTSPSWSQGMWDDSNYAVGKTQSVLDVLEALPSLGADEWSAEFLKNNNNNKTMGALAMIWNPDWTLERHLQEWSNTPQILVSPNWGNAWFRNIPLAQLVKETGCKLNRLRTKMQNVLYAPTPVTDKLHKERHDRIFQSTKGNYEYGAIHLRTVLSDASIRTGYDTTKMAKILSKCIDQAIKVQQKKKNLPTTTTPLQNWWLISDNLTIATWMQEALSNSVGPAGRHHNNYNIKVDKDPSFWKDSSHSGFAMKQKFNHAKLAPSILDFMVLHESKLTIITHGSFGSTGARGNGKIPLTTCGPRELFSIYG